MGRLLRYVRFPLLCCAVGLTVVFVTHGGLSPTGLEATWITLVLLALEISLSFDNAVVNARVLEQLTPGQQQFFLSWGLVIPVFGVRFLGPLLLVSLAGGIGLGTPSMPPCTTPSATTHCWNLQSHASSPLAGCFC